MTKVEELRERLLGNDPCYDMDDEGNMIQKGVVPHCIGIKAEEVDSLIAAARAEGAEEGKKKLAEDVREVMLSIHDGYDFDDDPAWKAYERIIAFLKLSPGGLM